MSTFGAAIPLAGFLVCGGAVLVGLGFVGSPRSLAEAAGMAIFCGWATTSLVLTLLAIAGVAPTLLVAFVVWALAAAAAIIASRSPHRTPNTRHRQREEGRGGKLVARTGMAALVAYMLLLLVRSWEPTGVLHADAWGQWLPKAKILYFMGLDTGPGGYTSQFNPDYPPLQPTSEALWFHALGGADALNLARAHWLLDVSFLFALAWLLAPRVRPAILWPSLAVVALTPAFGSLVGSLLADESETTLVAMAALTALLWLLDEDRRFLPLIMLFLAAATLTKNEGLMLSFTILAALAVTPDGRRQWKTLGVLGAGVLATRGIWKIWLVSHDVPRNLFYDLGDFLDPGYLVGRTHRFDYGLTQLLGQIATPTRWSLIVPGTLALAVLVARRLPTPAIFVVAFVTLDILGFTLVYWVSRVDLHFYVDNTVERLPAFIALPCAAVFPLLLQEALFSAAPCSTPGRTTFRRA